MRPHGRRALVDPENPRAFGVCDRCGQWVNHCNLQWQWDYRGNSLANLRILVCEICLDEPNPQLKPRIIGPDPLPIINARPETFFIDETDFRTTQGNTTDPDTGIPVPGGDTRVTETNATRVPQQTGEAPGGVNQTPGIDPAGNVPGSNDPGLPPGNTTPPETGPLT
jgi:hypothetical protein